MSEILVINTIVVAANTLVLFIAMRVIEGGRRY